MTTEESPNPYWRVVDEKPARHYVDSRGFLYSIESKIRVYTFVGDLRGSFTISAHSATITSTSVFCLLNNEPLA